MSDVFKTYEEVKETNKCKKGGVVIRFENISKGEEGQSNDSF